MPSRAAASPPLKASTCWSSGPAHELQQLGYTVTAPEARDRDGFEDGQYAEVGGVRISDVHA